MYERKTRKGQTTHQKLSAWTIRPDTGKGKPIKLPSASNLIHLIISINQGMGINSNGMVYTCVMQSSMYKQYRKLTWYRFYKVLFVHLFNQYFTHIKMYTDKVTFFLSFPLFFSSSAFRKIAALIFFRVYYFPWFYMLYQKSEIRKTHIWAIIMLKT